MAIFHARKKRMAAKPPRTTSDIIPGKNRIVRLGRRDIKVTFSTRSLGHSLLRFRYYYAGGLLLIALIVTTNLFFRTHASVAEFYPSSCLGGWENPANAADKPD